MRYSANLNIIVKAIEKATARMSRDFIELENLQTNSVSATKFATACYRRAKEVLADEFSRLRPEYDIVFSDGQKITRPQKAQYSYVIHAIDGFDNLLRSNPDFTVAVALEHTNANGQKEAISLAINKIVGGELYYCEKGFGAYLNSRRIRVSKRANSENPLVASFDSGLVKNFRAYGCPTMEIAYLASAKIDGAILKSDEMVKPFLLLVREAGGKVVEDEKIITANNGVI